MLCRSSIFQRGEDEGRRFEIEGGGNFLLGNQPLPSHSIQPDSFLRLELQIMGRELDFGSHVGDRLKKNIF